MGKIYRTAQGRSLDMETIRLQNEFVPALGNMRVNARGDQLGPGGKIIKSREQVMDEYYKTRPAVGDNIPTEGDIPTRSPTRRVSSPLTTSSKKAAEFKPADAIPDDMAPPASGKATEVEKELKGGLAAAVARTKKLEKKNKRVE
jgi:hypothetical protein